jgi:hypothetical protein
MKDNLFSSHAVLFFIVLLYPFCLIDEAISEEAAKRDTPDALISAVRDSINAGDMDAYLSLHFYKDTSDSIKQNNRDLFREMVDSDYMAVELVEFPPGKIEKMNAEYTHNCKIVKPTLPVMGGISVEYKKGRNEAKVTHPYGTHEGIYYLNSAAERPADKENPTSYNVIASTPDRFLDNAVRYADKPVKLDCVFFVSGKEVRERMEAPSSTILKKCGQAMKSCEASLLEPDGQVMLEVYRDGLMVFNSVSPDGKSITYSEQ